MNEPPRPTTTTDSGTPVSSDEHSLTVGPNGPTVLYDAHLVQKMQHFNRERVPERVVHAKGSGAHVERAVRAAQAAWRSGCETLRTGSWWTVAPAGSERACGVKCGS